MVTDPKHLRHFGSFRLDAQKKVLWHDDEPVNLPLKEVELLCVLTENVGEVVTKDELLNKLWADSFVEESNLSRHIYLLRKTFKDFGEEEDLIQTVPRRGYRFAGELREISDGALVIEKHSLTRTLIEEISEPQISQPQALPGASARPRTARIWIAASVILTSLAVASGFYLYRTKPESPSPRQQIKSIAVLPLKSFAPDTESEPLRLRITDAVITKLGNLQDVAVRPTSSVLRYSGDTSNAIEIGKVLNVDAVLEGRIQAEENRLRVTLQLISVQTGEQLWSAQFDGKMGETLALQDAISSRLRQHLAISENENASRRPTENNEVYEAYLKGRYLWNQRSAESYWRALDYFQRSVAIDQNFALGYSGIADCYTLLEQRQALPADEAYPKAEAAARRAVELDSTIAEAHVSMGLIAFLSHHDWTATEFHFKKAIELSPNYSGGHAHYGMALNDWGRFDESFGRLKQAENLDPTSRNIGIYLGVNFYYSKQFERAIAQFNRVLDFAPGTLTAYFFLTRIYELNGRSDEAVEADLKRRVTSHPESVESLRAAYQVGGIRGFWRKQIEVLRTESRNEPGLDYTIASRYALLNEADEALAYIKKNQTSRGSMWTSLNVDPSFETLRSNPKFQELAQRMTPH